MTGRKLFGLGVLLLFAIVILNSSFYSLNEYEQAVITQFGKPIGNGVKNPGLHAKIPFIQKLHRFEKRILIWDGSADQIPTSDKKYIWLDATARWRIKDPLLFYQSVGNVLGAQTRLDDIIDSASRDIVSGHLLIEVVRNSNRVVEELGKGGDKEEELVVTFKNIKLGREKLTHEILDRASELVPQYGIELLDVQIKRLNYVEAVRKKVYERMISERERIASKYRSEGEGKKAEITGMKQKELNRIQSVAYKKAQEIRGEADGKATKIYADAYMLDPEFYSFLKTLEVYKSTIGKNSQVIMTTDSDIYRYLKRIK